MTEREKRFKRIMNNAVGKEKLKRWMKENPPPVEWTKKGYGPYEWAHTEMFLWA